MPYGIKKEHSGHWKAYSVNDEAHKFVGFVYARSVDEADDRLLVFNGKFKIYGDPCPLQFWSERKRHEFFTRRE